MAEEQELYPEQHPSLAVASERSFARVDDEAEGFEPLASEASAPPARQAAVAPAENAGQTPATNDASAPLDGSTARRPDSIATPRPDGVDALLPDAQGSQGSANLCPQVPDIDPPRGEDASAASGQDEAGFQAHGPAAAPNMQDDETEAGASPNKVAAAVPAPAALVLQAPVNAGTPSTGGRAPRARDATPRSSADTSNVLPPAHDPAMPPAALEDGLASPLDPPESFIKDFWAREYTKESWLSALFIQPVKMGLDARVFTWKQFRWIVFQKMHTARLRKDIHDKLADFDGDAADNKEKADKLGEALHMYGKVPSEVVDE